VKTISKIAIRAATPADVPAITALLREAQLPSDDFLPQLACFLVADAGPEIVGVIGAEVCGTDALLRSLVVATAHRGAGIGGRLVADLERAAVTWHVDRWWLLTTTAEKFFAVRGFRVAARESAPEGIRRTGQFSGGICRSAVCMTRERKTAS
jgi:amino-acid N-acetyltransferase